MILLITFTMRPRENLVVGQGEEYFQIFKYLKKLQILYDYVNTIYHETTRKSCGGVGLGIFSPRDHKIQKRFLNAIGKCRFYMILLIKFTTRPRENLVVGQGVEYFQNCQMLKKNVDFIKKFTMRPRENLLVEEGVEYFFNIFKP